MNEGSPYPSGIWASKDMATPLLEIATIRHGYNGHRVLNEFSLALGRGQIGCILGPSGCGKTTALRCISGFEKIGAGRMRRQGAAGGGQIGGILGPSGCGKTTALRCIAGFEKIAAGRIVVNGADVSRPGHA